MSIEELQSRTTVNIQEKANLIWAIADKLVGTYKPHEYGNVILPMCVIKRFSDTLAGTKERVIAKNKELDSKNIQVKDGFLRAASGYDFYNVSPFTFEGLLSDAENIADNFRSYLNHFSVNVIDVIEKFEFDKEITKLSNNGILYNVISEFCSKKAYMGADEISAVDMGYIFEELVRKFSESYDEHAGAHFTARDIIYLMAEVLVAPQKNDLQEEGITATMYDMAMGTSQMLDCLSEKLLQIDAEAQLTEFGQELNEQTYAIAKANMLIKGGDADNMKHGNTLSDDKFDGYKFDYIISNPPFGIEWKNEKAAVEAEHKRGEMGRFGAGLPAVGDSQQLFMLNGVAKLKETGRMAIIQNGSPLFKGDAGSGESNIRGYLLENDWLEAIIQIPNDMFYNTGIATYIWIVSKDKSAERAGKVQLIDASKCCVKRRKPLGNKRNEFTDDCIKLITEAYNAFADGVYTNEAGLEVEVKIKQNEDFKYSKVTVEQPLCDDSGKPVLKKGKPTADASKRDTESIPWSEPIEEYMQKNVYPYAPDAWIDEKKSKIGYEIPFTREFYKYVAPRSSEEIFAHLQELEKAESALMAKIMKGN
ncbi:MAG: SAM-dependent DNA methyltransferase [Paludibacteraceae bacterium]|nr:SAM-dependent DNA methyltransferase [Paludibacteraceae bacterium]